MPRFEPFPGLRYDPARVRLADVVAPPYDVVAPEERAQLQSRSPYNSIRIELPDAEGGRDPYEAAAWRVAEWQAQGVLRRDLEPSLYGYRMSYRDDAGRDRQTVGVIGALGLEPPGTAGIFPHERTTPKAKSDRLHLLQATGLNTSPIWGLSLAAGLSNALVAPATAETIVDSEGIRHDLWPITDPAAIATVAAAISNAPIVIADGHHRFETALTFQRECSTDETDGAGEAADHTEAGPTVAAAPSDFVMALVVELVDEQLSVQGIHRLVGGLPPDFDLVDALGRYFELIPTGAADSTVLDRMVTNDAIALVTPTRTWLLRARPETAAAAGQDLDSSRLEVALAALPDHEVEYQHGWDLAVGAVTRGDAQAAVLLRPVTVEQIALTGRGGERMPPKTTFFWPKPRTGFVFREVRA